MGSFSFCQEEVSLSDMDSFFVRHTPVFLCSSLLNLSLFVTHRDSKLHGLFLFLPHASDSKLVSLFAGNLRTT